MVKSMKAYRGKRYVIYLCKCEMKWEVFYTIKDPVNQVSVFSIILWFILTLDKWHVISNQKCWCLFIWNAVVWFTLWLMEWRQMNSIKSWRISLLAAHTEIPKRGWAYKTDLLCGVIDVITSYTACRRSESTGTFWATSFQLNHH